MIAFDVYGNPAPQGSKRFVGTTKAGRGLMIESSKKLKPWRMDVKAAAEAAQLEFVKKAPWQRLDGPLCVSMVFTLPKPSSAPKKRRTWPDRQPDLSKLIRSTEDAITDAGLWADDARVVEVAAQKVYPGDGCEALGSPGVRVRIWQVESDIG